MPKGQEKQAKREVRVWPAKVGGEKKDVGQNKQAKAGKKK